MSEICHLIRELQIRFDFTVAGNFLKTPSRYLHSAAILALWFHLSYPPSLRDASVYQCMLARADRINTPCSNHQRRAGPHGHGGRLPGQCVKSQRQHHAEEGRESRKESKKTWKTHLPRALPSSRRAHQAPPRLCDIRHVRGASDQCKYEENEGRGHRHDG